MTGNTRNRKSKKLHNIVLTGLFSAIIFVFTAYIHIPSGSGYTHAGDGLIYLAACILPTPYAAASAAIGGALADGLAGFPVWIPATIAIKSVTVLFFTSKTSKILTLRNICGIIPSLIICIAGYTLYEGTIITGGSTSAIIAAAEQIPSYCIQVLASSALFIITATALDKSNFRKNI